MKKFFLTTTVPQTLFFFSDQCKELKENYDIRAISTDNERLRQFGEQEGIPVIGLKMERDISIFNDFVSLFRWIWLLLKERPYIVHGNTPKASLLSMVAAWLTCRPVRIYMCHGLRYQGCAGIKRRLLMFMERITCLCATQVICVSAGVREQMAQDSICPLKKSRVILYGSANGVDTDFFNSDIVDDAELKARYGIESTDFPIVFIGRIVRDKGVEELVDVVNSMRNEGFHVKLLLVGGRESSLDALYARTEELIRVSDFIIDCGRQSDVRPFIKMSRCLVLPSYREGFGQVLVEANSMGIPVIASNIAGCKNVVSEGVNGMLCEPQSAQSLYECLLRMISDVESYGYMRNHCREYIIERFDRKKVARAYLDYYFGLI